MKFKLSLFGAYLWFAMLLVGAVFLSGCKTTPQTTKQMVKSAVQLGVSFGVQQAPDAVQYLRYAAPVICEAGSGTNVQPAWVIAKLEANAQANAVKNPQAVMIFNAAFGIYESLYLSYGAEEVANRAMLQAWLAGTCEGILAGLPAEAGTRGLKPLPVHLHWP